MELIESFVIVVIVSFMALYHFFKYHKKRKRKKILKEMYKTVSILKFYGVERVSTFDNSYEFVGDSFIVLEIKHVHQYQIIIIFNTKLNKQNICESDFHLPDYIKNIMILKNFQKTRLLEPKE